MRKAGLAKSLFISVLTMLMLVSLVTGGTFAYFSDSFSIKDNVITAGSVNVDAMLYKGVDSVSGTVADKIEENNFQPGDTSNYSLLVENKGTLDAKYKVIISATDTTLFNGLTITYGGTALTLKDDTFQTDWQDITLLAVKTEMAMVITFNNGSGNEYVGVTKSFKFDIDILAIQASAVTNVVYASTLEQINNASLSQTIILGKDIIGDVNLNNAVNIDMNGHKINGNLTITDNTAKNIQIGNTVSADEVITGNVTIIATEATVILNAKVGGSKVVTATSQHSFYFNGGFISSGSIEVMSGKAVLNANADVLIKAPTAEVANAKPVIIEIAKNASIKITIDASVANDNVINIVNEGLIETLTINNQNVIVKI